MIEYGTIALRQFPRYEKFVLAAMIRQQMYEVLKLIVETNKRTYRKTAMTELDISHSDIAGHVFRTAVIDSGFMLKQCLIWVKSSAVMSRQDYNWQHEPILYGWKPGRAHYFCMDYTLTTVIEENRPNRNELHPTQKPIPLVGRMIRNSTPDRPGVLVLDGFGGSGTTLMACEQMGRACCTMEKDPVYCDVIVKRWEQFTGKKAELLRSGVGQCGPVQAEDLCGMIPAEASG